MPLRALVDNDVLAKAACYGLLEEILVGLGGPGSLGVLGSARFVIGDLLKRDGRITDRQHVISRWTAFLPHADELEPTPTEVELATELQETASGDSFALDGGESLLCAIAITRRVPCVITGDKRAIEALQRLLPSFGILRELVGRVVCLEQVIEALVPRIGIDALRDRICREPGSDLALALVFQCGQGTQGAADPAGLSSYIGNMRSRAPDLLVERPPF